MTAGDVAVLIPAHNEERVLLLDADTTIEPGYFEAALPHFDDPKVVAVAGAVRTHWHERGLSLIGKVLVCRRQRIYAISQRLLKFGQTWRFTNATHIVPGFASMYRTSVLPMIEMNPSGLVIKDFNMTFEVYQRRHSSTGRWTSPARRTVVARPTLAEKMTVPAAVRASSVEWAE